MKIKVSNLETERQRAVSDLLEIYYMDTFINVKGYLQKLVDNLYELGYYEDNESIFLERNA